MTRQQLNNLELENLESLRCTSCGANASQSELTNEDVELLQEVQCCLMCSANLECLEVECATIN